MIKKGKLFTKQILVDIYDRLLTSYGPQDWWPANSRFEIMVGAILTQNTAWTNVEKAIQNLKRQKALKLDAILSLSEQELAELIRPSGYFNVKAKRLKHYCAWYSEQGEYRMLKQFNTNQLRNALLSVNGVGPETADDILLYAFERPVFVIDTYTRRLFKRLGVIQSDEPYETLRLAFEDTLGRDDAALFNEYHALIVRHEKERCSNKKDCPHCFVEKNITC